MCLNGLKKANDTLGHSAGDELICAAANCMKFAFASYGKIYRIGGDEFVVWIQESVSNIDSILQVFDELFLKRTDYVSHKEVAELLNLKSFGPKDSRKEGKFKNRYTLYQNIISVFPQFELHSILDLFNEDTFNKTGYRHH